jgi:hypothetical protein
MTRRRLEIVCLWALGTSMAACGATPKSAAPAAEDDASAGSESGAGSESAGGAGGTSGGSNGRTGGSAGGGGTGGAPVTGDDASPEPDAMPASADTEPSMPATLDGGPSGGAGAGGAGGAVDGMILFQMPDTLPAIVGSHPSGDATWIDDPMEGKVVRFRAIDGGDVKERAEIDMAKDILKNGDTVWVGWKAKLEIANPGQQWRNIFQEKSYGSYQENVPFCLRADSNTLRLLDQNAKSIWTHPMILDTWFSIVMKIVYGTGQTGTIELWIDGQPQKFSDGTNVGHLGTWGGGMQNMHWGIYRKGIVSGTDIHYVAHLRVATTQAAATPP